MALGMYRPRLLLRRYGTAEAQRVRTRFAPSPTGMMHIGGLRTALFNYLLSRQRGGEFLLRIEDTDRLRVVPGSTESIRDALEWIGVFFDEGPGVGGPVGPYVQSERLPAYREHAERLVQTEHAYRCFCTAERLDALRRQQALRGVTSMYDRYCLKMSRDAAQQRLEQGRRFVIRLKVPSGSTTVCDDLLGKVCFKNRTIDDQVLLKSDGTPTYHLASVVDDHLMGITHVIRGEEWLASTPKHLMLYRAFGWQEPKFLHLPLLLNEDRTKLSKRHAHTSVQWYKDQGYLPEAVANFVAFLGWTPPMSESTREVLTLEEIARLFDVKDLNKSGAMVQLKKLNWLNSQHLKRLAQDDPQTLVQRLAPYLERRLDVSKASPEYLKRVFVTLILQDTKFCTIPQLIERSLHFFVSPDYQSGEASATLKRIVRPYTCHLLDAFLAAADPPEWSKSHISGLLLAVLKSARTEAPDVKKADLYQVIRLALTGLAEGVDLLVTIEILGRKTCIERVASFRRLPSLSDAARERCRSQEDLAS